MNEQKLKEIVQPVITGCTITTIEDYGDIFAVYFVNDKYYESKRIEDLLIGAGPIIYIKSTGEIFETGSAYSAEFYVTSYRECGNVYGRPGEYIKIYRIDTDENKAIFGLKAVLRIGLKECRELLNSIAHEGSVTIFLNSEEDAEMAVKKLCDQGVRAKQIWRPIC